MFYSDKRKRVSLDFSKDKKVTVDYYRDECDINLVVKRYRDVNQYLNTFDASKAMYEDITQVPTNFTDAIKQVREAEETYYQMPAKVRQMFGSPEAFLDAFNHESMRPVLTELGFLRQSTNQDTQQVAGSAESASE